MGFKENIKALRLYHELSQKDFGLIAGVTDKAVSTWEKGTKEPKMAVIEKIAEHFGIKKTDILDDESVIKKIAKKQYYDDIAVEQYAEKIKNNPDLRILFDASQGLSKEEIDEVVNFVKFQKMKSEGVL